MREIIFRGRRLDNGEWAYGFYASGLLGDNAYIIGRGFEATDAGFHAPECHSVIPSTIGQFTGLCDKNGKRIFEGDVCRVFNPNGEQETDSIVEYVEKWSCYPYEPEDGFDAYDITAIGWAMEMGYEFEILSTIHDEATKGVKA
jgi:uncharacterized phage protein (TIGR01671 family)